MTVRASIWRAHPAVPSLKRQRAKADLLRRMSTLVRVLLLGLIAVMPARAFAIEPVRPGQGSYLTRAIYAEGRLWVLSDAGDLSSVTEGRDARVAETLPEKAFDLCARDGHPVVITGAAGSGPAWTLRQRA